MEGVFKLTEPGIKKLALHECRNALLRYLFILLAVIILSIITNKDASVSVNNLLINSIIIVCTFGIAAIILYRFKKIFYSAFTVEIFKNSVKRTLDYNQIINARGIFGIMLHFRRNIYKNTELSIYYRNIISIKPHKVGILIVSNQPGEKIIIPSGIEHFEEIKQFILERAEHP